MKNKKKEIYDLKHDLISNQVKTETAEESLKKLERDNKELLLNKARLEAALEDKLLWEKTARKSLKKRTQRKNKRFRNTKECIPLCFFIIRKEYERKQSYDTTKYI